jgi:hypothetical protein
MANLIISGQEFSEYITPFFLARLTFAIKMFELQLILFCGYLYR